MSPRRLRLEGESLDELITLARSRYGTGARIVSVEKVTVGGVFGFLAKRHFEVTVELPDEPGSGRRKRGTSESLGLAALIEKAELDEANEQQLPSQWQPSTQSDDFAALMDSLTFHTKQPPRLDAPRILNPGSFDDGSPPAAG